MANTDPNGLASLDSQRIGNQSWGAGGDPYAAAHPTAPTAPGGFSAPGPGDFDLSGISLGRDGHLYGERRIISGDPNTPGMSKYDFETVDLGDAGNIAAISAQWGIPSAALDQRYQELKVQNAQTQANGYGHLISVNPDGSFTYQDPTGVRQTTSDPAALAAVGITTGDIAQQKAQAAQTQKTLTGQGQYEAVTANPDGTIAVRDYYGTVTNVPAAKAQTMPGIAPGQVQYLQQQGNERNWQGAQATNYGALAQGAGNSMQGAMPPGPGLPGSASAPGITPRFLGGATQNPTAPPTGSGPAPLAGGYGSGATSYGATPPRFLGGATQQGGVAPPSASQQAAYSAYQGGMQQGANPSRMPGGGPTGQYQNGGGPTPNPTPTPPGGGGGPTGQYASPGYGYNASGFDGTNQQLGQANTGMQQYYLYGKNQFDIAHQAQDQQNTAYRYNQTQTEAQNAGQSRNMGGMGWSGLTRPAIAGSS